MRRVKASLKPVLFLALLAVAGATSCAATFGNTAAIVNGNRISQKKVDQILPVVRAVAVNQGLSDTEIQRQAVLSAIGNELFREVAKQRHIEPTTTDIEQAYQQILSSSPYNGDVSTLRQAAAGSGYTLATLRTDFIYNRLITNRLESELAPPPTADQIAAVYKQQSAQFRQVMVKHILFAVSAGTTDAQALKKANDALAQLKAGADFATLAKKLSDDPGSKSSGGVLQGWIPVAQLDQSFGAAAWAAPIGKLTGPVRSQFGYHIIVTLKKRIQPLAEVEAQIKQSLEGQAGPQALSDFITTIIKKSKIVVNPRYGDWDATTQSVVAHQFFRPAPGETPSPTETPSLILPTPAGS